MGGSSGPQTPKITAETNRQKAIERASQLFDQGIGGQAYTKSLVPEMNENRVSAYNLIGQNARANSGGAGMSGAYQSVLDNGGYTNAQLGALSQMQNFSNGTYRTDTSRQAAIGDGANWSWSEKNLGNIADGSAYQNRDARIDQNINNATRDTDLSRYQALESDLTSSYAQDNLSDIASGAYLGGNDPYFEQVLNNALADASNGVNMGASAAGRYGSAVHQGNVASELGQLSSQARLDQYIRERQAQVEANAMLDAQRNANLNMRYNVANSVAENAQADRARQLAASQALSDQYNQGLANQMQASVQMDTQRNANLDTQLTAANAISAAQAADYDRQMAATNQAYEAAQQSLANMQAAYQGMNAPAQDLAAIGQAYEELEARKLADQYRIFQEQQNAPWNLVARMQGVNAGASTPKNDQGSGGDRG